MIYTVTFNPCLDYVIKVDELHPGMVNRAVSESITEGGKGINVSIVLKNLGIDSTALGFIAGFTGEQIRSSMEQRGCRTDFVKVEDGFSRINVKLKEKTETDINGQGPEIAQKHLDMLFLQLDDLDRGDTLVLAGSIPDTLPADIYEKIMERMKEKELRIVVDATGELLMRVLKYRPFLIKPNNHELADLFQAEIQTEADIIHYAGQLQEMGARNVLISRAGDGAVLLAEDRQIYRSAAPGGKVIDSVGAGDSMVAGFLAGYMREEEKASRYENAFKMGVATGSASAFSVHLATEQEVEVLLKTI